MASLFSTSPKLAFALTLATAVFLCNAPRFSSAPPPLPTGDDVDAAATHDAGLQKAFDYLQFVLGPLLVLFLFFAFVYIFYKRTILMVQVVVSANAGDIGSLLRGIAETEKLENNATPKRIVKALLEHQTSFIYGSTYVDVTGGVHDVSLHFGFSRFIGYQAWKQGIQVELLKENFLVVPKLQASKQDKDCTVVTFMATAKGAQKLPSIESCEDIERVLNCLVYQMPIIRAETIWSYHDPASLEKLVEPNPHMNVSLASLLK